MSTTPLKGEITCSICFNIYNEPHVLRECLHTFCLKCIGNIQIRGRIQCPECRKYTSQKHIKKDFKTQRLIDMFETESNITEVNGTTCGMCYMKMPIKSLCIECEHYMCASCQLIHQGLKLAKDHTIKQVGQTIEARESKLKKCLSDLETEHFKMHDNSVELSKHIEHVVTEQKKQVSDVKMYTDDAIKTLKANQIYLEYQINNANENVINHITKQKQIYDQNCNEIQKKINYVHGMLEKHDVTALIEKADRVDESMRSEVKKINTNIPGPVIISKSPVTVKKGISLDIQNMIKVHIHKVKLNDHPKDSVKIEKESSGEENGAYSHVHKVKYNKRHQRHELVYSPYTICLINDLVCCAGLNDLYLYTKDCELIKKISHKSLKCLRSVINCDNQYLVVACFNKGGLHQLDSKGQYIDKIADGSFSGICYYDGKLYALNYETCQVVVLKYYGKNQWEQEGDISLNYKNGDDYDRISVSRSGIYVSSYCNSSLYKHSSDGKFQSWLGSWGRGQPGYIFGPLLCGADNEGNLLVADNDNKRLQVCDAEGKWTEVALPVEIGEPMHAAVDKSGDLFITTHVPKRLLKFKPFL